MKTTTLKYKELSLGDEVGLSNPRVDFDPKTIEELATSIAEHGLFNPLLVWRVKREGKTYNVILGGGRRYRAIGNLIKAKPKPNGIEEVPVRIVEADSAVEARFKALTDNIQREQLSSYEIAREIAGLKRMGLQQKEIATKLGKSQAFVSRALAAFTKCSPAVVEAWRDGILPADDVQTLSKLEEVEQDRRLSTVLKHRAKAAEAPGEARKEKAEARKAAKGAPGKAEAKDGAKAAAGDVKLPRMPEPKLRELVEFCGKAAKKQRYVLGMRDGIRLVLGDLATGDLDKEFNEFATAKGLLK